MSDYPAVRLEPAVSADAGLLANLLELYIHDLSEVFPVELKPDGRFGYPKLPQYFSEPARRFPFLVKRDGKVAGFAFAVRGSPVVADPEVFDVAEFFVMRAHRRGGTGRHAAFALWDRFPGKWTVRVSQGNRTALPFWDRVVGEYTEGAVETFEHPGTLHPWRVHLFDSRARRERAR